MNKSDCPTICEVTMNEEKTQIADGVASELNAELDVFLSGDRVSKL